MTGAVEAEFRASNEHDLSALLALYCRAFPDEDLSGLVTDLLSSEEGVLSLVALRDRQITGHIALTVCDAQCALLGPLAVAPEAQKQGIGTALVHAICTSAQRVDVQQVFLLGDPAYYGRLGFATERKVRTPHPIPEAWAPAWQSRVILGEGRGDSVLKVPKFWDKSEYWSD